MGFGYAWISQENVNGRAFVNEFYVRCIDCDVQNWRAKLRSVGTLSAYRNSRLKGGLLGKLKRISGDGLLTDVSMAIESVLYVTTMKWNMKTIYFSQE